MKAIDLSHQEVEKLKRIEEKNWRKFLLSYLMLVALFIIAFIPAKYLPRRLRDMGKSTYTDESIISLVGFNNFLIFFVIWTAIMTWAALSTYKNISIKKDLKERRKKIVEGTVSYVGVYEGEHFVRLKRGTGVKVIRFDRSNYRPLSVGDKISFEVYEHSKILINVLSNKPKAMVAPKMAEVIEVVDKCPACNHGLSPDDYKCPDCGLNFS